MVRFSAAEGRVTGKAPERSAKMNVRIEYCGM
jgi:hypothetical protein